MALTPTEKQRRYRARLKEKKKAIGDSTRAFLKTPFFEFFQSDPDNGGFELALDVAGFDPYQFRDDRGPASFTGESEHHGHFTNEQLNSRSIGRAELMVGCFLDAASYLALIINRYKKQEIGRAIAELENADLSHPAVRKKALADIVRLNKIRDRLDKTLRWSLPEYKVKEED
jgi:hypothetical protein